MPVIRPFGASQPPQPPEPPPPPRAELERSRAQPAGERSWLRHAKIPIAAVLVAALSALIIGLADPGGAGSSEPPQIGTQAAPPHASAKATNTMNVSVTVRTPAQVRRLVARIRASAGHRRLRITKRVVTSRHTTGRAPARRHVSVRRHRRAPRAALRTPSTTTVRVPVVTTGTTPTSTGTVTRPGNGRHLGNSKAGGGSGTGTSGTTQTTTTTSPTPTETTTSPGASGKRPPWK